MSTRNEKFREYYGSASENLPSFWRGWDHAWDYGREEFAQELKKAMDDCMRQNVNDADCLNAIYRLVVREGEKD
jgi:hypothetical protein